MKGVWSFSKYDSLLNLALFSTPARRMLKIQCMAWVSKANWQATLMNPRQQNRCSLVQHPLLHSTTTVYSSNRVKGNVTGSVIRFAIRFHQCSVDCSSTHKLTVLCRNTVAGVCIWNAKCARNWDRWNFMSVSYELDFGFDSAWAHSREVTSHIATKKITTLEITEPMSNIPEHSSAVLYVPASLWTFAGG